MSNIHSSKLAKWEPNIRDFSHHKRFEHLYGATVPIFNPSGLGRQRRAILDQGMSDECTDFQGAVRAGYRYGQDFSHKYQGAKEGEIANASIINGTQPRNALAVPNTFGALPIALEPSQVANMTPEQYLDWHQWPLSLDPSAAKFMEVAYNLVDGPYDPFDNLRTVLLQAHEEGEVVLVFSSWFEEWNHTNGVMPMPTSISEVNHAHLFIDWTLINGEPMLIDHLSQGTGFGASGFGYFNRAIVNKFVESGDMGCYIFRQHPQQLALNQAVAELDQIGLDFIQRILAAYNKNPTISASTFPPGLYNAAKKSLGKHMTLNEAVPDEVGCAEAVSAVLALIGISDGPKGIAGTAALYSWLESNPRFEKIESPEEGAIIISPTGTGNDTIPGHTGVVAAYDLAFSEDWGIMSNDSASGKFMELWSLSRWDKYYGGVGALPTYFFHLT